MVLELIDIEVLVCDSAGLEDALRGGCTQDEPESSMGDFTPMLS